MRVASADIGRYLVWSETAEDAVERVRAAGFHKTQISRHWSPAAPPPEGLPADMGPDFTGWYRSRWDDDGWTPWEMLPADYRHPPQGLAAMDPSMR